MPFMRYVRARSKQEKRVEVYRVYVTDALRAFGGFSPRYADESVPYEPVPETRTDKDIISEISERLTKLGGG